MSLKTADIFKTLYYKNKNLISLNDDDLNEIQKQLLKMADDIIGVLEENNCIYYLTGGSALGAVRHNGFIPWDDDMDIGIARESYDIFITKFTKKYNNKYWIHTPYSEEKFCLPSNQIRLKNTIYMTINDYTEEECGLPIDLFIIENTFNNCILRFFHGIISEALGLIVSCRKFYQHKNYYLNLVNELPKEKKIFKKKIKIGQLFSFFSLRKWTILYNKCNSICKNNNSRFVVVPTGRKRFFGEIYKRNKFFNTKKELFCGRYWDIPYDYDYYLTKLYGKYMDIPKEKEQHVLFRFRL